MIFLNLLWSIRALAAKTFPSSRDDNKPWLASDERRRDRAGTAMRLRCAVLYHKADWAEYSASYGFPTWQDNLRPCFACNGFGAGLFLAMGNTAVSLRWDLTSDEDYYAACARCEIKVTVATESERSRIIRVLRYDKHPDGARGRALVQEIPEMNLAQGDRVEPGGSLSEVGELEDVELPALVVFWRRANETISRHRCALLNEPELGLTPTRSITVHSLHCLFLGVKNAYDKTVMWTIFIRRIRRDWHRVTEFAGRRHGQAESVDLVV